MKSSSSRRNAAAAASRVRTYFANLPPDARRRLGQVRTIIRGVAPGAVDHFSYGIPGLRLDDKPFIWYAAFKHHTSLFPIRAAIRRTYAAELEGYKTATGTVQFPLDEPLPTTLVKKLVKARVAEMRTKDKA
jgi:uncharacterized protein YdhG (YjbR/CyaY superfamily)